MPSQQNKKDLRTLLFCKIPTADAFQDLARLACKQVDSSENDASWKMYYAFGGYNALCVYPTLPAKEMKDGPNWLSKVYEDKQRFASNVTEQKLVCHQMHLISRNDYSGFWATDKTYPILFVTLVYGVLRTPQEEGKESNENYYCSLYESCVANYLDNALRQERNKNHCQYAIYNGINIGDVVIFWKSNDVEKTLSLISKLGYGNVARKTLTTIALPINSIGKIYPSALLCLQNASSEGKLEILMRGTVKNAIEFNSFVDELRKLSFRCGNGSFALSLNPGKYDFTLSKKVTSKELSVFLTDILLGQGELICLACWELHTDLLVPKSKLAGELPNSTALTPVITNLYEQYLEIYKSKQDKYRFSWWNSLLELYSTQYYIDRHPTLHGPSYLVYHSLHILNDYLENLPTDSTKDNSVLRVITRSEDSINHYISCLNLLMDQITHNDNAMISGYPNVHSILFSLPESMLDFYHAFLRAVVEVLNKFDGDRIPRNFEYDFLFTPQQGPRFRFCPVINAGIDLRKDKNSEKVWPAWQAYVLEVPMKSLFEPMQLFPPMVHECFHCFGDVLRKREKRKDCMGHFLATTIATALGFGTRNFTLVERALHDYLCDNSNTDVAKSRYLLEVVDCFKKKLQSLFSQTCSIDAVFEKSGNTAYVLYTSATRELLRKIALNFYGGDDKVLGSFSVLCSCKYYFKECYADTMTIALLELSPTEYLTLILSELDLLTHSEASREQQNEHETELAQRLAIVMAACCKFNLSGQWTSNTGEAAITQFKESCDAETENGTLCYYLKEYFLALLDKTHVINPLQRAENEAKARFPQAAFPPATLYSVVDYLLECLNELIHAPSIDSEPNDITKCSLQTLRSDFDQIIRGGDMFSQRFYEIIYQQHEEIRKAIKSK